MMKKIIAIVTTSVLFFSCDEFSYEIPADFKRPIIVTAIDKADETQYGSVIVRDSTGRMWHHSGYDSHCARAIIASYNVGDTLK